MRLLLIDDHALSRQGCELLLQKCFPSAEISSAASLAEQSERSTPEQSCSESPDLVLFVAHLQGLSENKSELAQICEVQSVLILSLGGTGEDAAEAVAMGARGYVGSMTNPAALPHIVQLILSGEKYFPMSAAGPPTPARMVSLTLRQEQVLLGVMAGKPNKVIARDNGITEGTVKVHIRAVMEKFQARNRTELAIRMLRYQTSKNARRLDHPEDAAAKSSIGLSA